ncbi:sensory neuron membrane protein 1-like [Sitodiplosis mosellana]|uniref:sensory neuron membrane protein 1-like n=1 Tax=Sitodiplosis mosellana TaxID=263140 RepID=UPI002444D2DD|nr:sensory neuron membrane protein 1-like [Sitodiplosis mosellana]
MTRTIFEKIPFPLNYKLYMFNVTNKDEVLAGGKPILQEIGPYYFEEYIDKFDIVDNKDEDTIVYEFRKTYQYKPEKNGPGLTGEEIVTVANPLLLSVILAINTDRPDLLSFIHKAANGVLHNPQDIFYTGRLWDLLYDGIVLDCSSDQFEVTAACSEFDSGDYGEIRRINDTAFLFSMFGNTNGSSTGRYKAFRGKKNIMDVGQVLEYNGISEMDAWYEDECNQVSGTDGTIFPPFQQKQDGFTIYIPQMCRGMTAEYQQSSKFSGIKTNRYTMSFDVSKYGSPNCYCRNEDSCPPEGILDLFPCVGTTIAISLPHFYKVDPAVGERLIGLNPDPEKHEFYLDFYQLAGAPVSAMPRVQVNFEVVPIEEIPYMKDLQPMYLPLLWLEDGVDMPKKFINMLKYQLILALKFQKLMQYGCIIGGIIGLIMGGIAGYIQTEKWSDHPSKSVINRCDE